MRAQTVGEEDEGESEEGEEDSDDAGLSQRFYKYTVQVERVLSKEKCVYAWRRRPEVRVNAAPTFKEQRMPAHPCSSYGATAGQCQAEGHQNDAREQLDICCSRPSFVH